jgi:hypothetical protein
MARNVIKVRWEARHAQLVAPGTEVIQDPTYTKYYSTRHLSYRGINIVLYP